MNGTLMGATPMSLLYLGTVRAHGMQTATVAVIGTEVAKLETREGLKAFD